MQIVYFFCCSTIGNCQRPVFSLGVSQLTEAMHTLRDNNGEISLWSHHGHTKLFAFNSRPQNLILKSRNQIRGKLLLSRKLCYVRGSLTMFNTSTTSYPLLVTKWCPPFNISNPYSTSRTTFAHLHIPAHFFTFCFSGMQIRKTWPQAKVLLCKWDIIRDSNSEKLGGAYIFHLRSKFYIQP